MSTTFLIAAALLLAGSIAIVVWPLWRTASTPRAAPLAALLACSLPVFAALLYRQWSDYAWDAPTAGAEDPAVMVARLARRLEREPDDREGWLTLGRSYLVLGQFPLSARAFQRADRLANGQDADAIVGWAEALFRGDEAEIDGRAGRLFERALSLNPQSTKALLFGAIAAQRRGELALARVRYEKVLAAGPPEELRAPIEQQIAQLGGSAPAATSESRVLVDVALADAVAPQARSDMPLFVLARRPGEPGPPLAVKKLDGRFPQQVVLTAADAMLPSRTLASGETVEVVAR
jgi:cytochrome c-type biogenesis protein CcmH